MLAEIGAWEKAADDTVTQAIPLLAELGTTDESDHTLAQGTVNRNADRQPLENELATSEKENSLAQTRFGPAFFQKMVFERLVPEMSL